jgi:hypothetical protein
METLELPSIEERDETRPELPPVNFVEQEIDLAPRRDWECRSCLQRSVPFRPTNCRQSTSP